MTKLRMAMTYFGRRPGDSSGEMCRLEKVIEVSSPPVGRISHGGVRFTDQIETFLDEQGEITYSVSSVSYEEELGVEDPRGELVKEIVLLLSNGFEVVRNSFDGMPFEPE